MCALFGLMLAVPAGMEKRVDFLNSESEGACREAAGLLRRLGDSRIDDLLDTALRARFDD